LPFSVEDIFQFRIIYRIIYNSLYSFLQWQYFIIASHDSDRSELQTLREMHCAPVDLAHRGFHMMTLAQRYQADPSAADWRRFGRLPGFTNCKPKYLQSNGLYPYVLLRRWTREQHRMASYLRLEMTKLYQLQQQERQVRIAQHQAAVYSPSRGSRYSLLSLERFRNSAKYQNVPAPPRSPFASPHIHRCQDSRGTSCRLLQRF
jgi:hypothetical protein